jgi:hypothetical protein
MGILVCAQHIMKVALNVLVYREEYYHQLLIRKLQAQFSLAGFCLGWRIIWLGRNRNIVSFSRTKSSCESFASSKG